MAKKKVCVESTLGGAFVFESDVRGHRVVIDQPEETGGTDTGPTPLEMMFVALAGCIGSLGRIVAMQKRIELRNLRIKVEGDLDLDGLLGKPIEGRIGFEGITISVDVDADLSDEEKDAFLLELERRCPVSENLMNATPLNIKTM